MPRISRHGASVSAEILPIFQKGGSVHPGLIDFRRGTRQDINVCAEYVSFFDETSERLQGIKGMVLV